MNHSRLEDMTLNHLKILKVVDECHSFSGAAKKLGYSQALISKKVKQLEEYFGVRLLTRSPGTIGLTPKGKQLIEQSYSFVENVEKLQQEFQITLSLEGENIVLGATSLLAETWLKAHLNKFQLCFPGSLLHQEVVGSQDSFSNTDLSHVDLLINSTPTYQDSHHCTQLESYPLLLIAFDPEFETSERGFINSHQIELDKLVLLDEIYQQLVKNPNLDKDSLAQAKIFKHYEEAMNYAVKHDSFTVLPAFCQKYLEQEFHIQVLPISDIIQYGIYIHVQKYSEPLVLAESLVRSFRLDDKSAQAFHIKVVTHTKTNQGQKVIRLGIQESSVGQTIASYGVQHISNMLHSGSLDIQAFKNGDFEQDIDLQITALPSIEVANRLMKRGDLDLCILDDVALLNNGSYFFHDLSFDSKLIAIASYNLSGHDTRIVLPKKTSIQSVHDLRGKRIATQFGSNAHRFIMTLLDFYGINSESDCDLIDEEPKTAINSLMSRRIDAYVGCETFASWAQSFPFLQELPQDLMPAIHIPSLRGIVCRSQFMKESPKSVLTYLNRLLLANHWYHSNPLKVANILEQLSDVSASQILQFFADGSGSRTDPTLKPQWSWLLKTLNRRLDGRAGIAQFDVDFWLDDYLLRLVYNLLDLDYHIHQVSFANAPSDAYFLEEKFSRHIEFFQSQDVS